MARATVGKESTIETLKKKKTKQLQIKASNYGEAKWNSACPMLPQSVMGDATESSGRDSPELKNPPGA